ncbi:FKBP-type peptidyl-prolyl cis-trans isomerase [Novosphingobium sp. P6W]|uniref:FKBP-type peptidyl-prolyl cis-trans isomerase n=1 Tax=Novosphingobium sp. P6W TaxID=1609758 RepID=UPI0005C2C752|nr:FKBP-type peptidyl-prolyl cis-trans isomerase [Novosphingobium sp. P6W]AXB76191.1 peptidylprolyl isomerase [Novosphingobium sp. P6W]KIS31432.1 peptidylprolyl isomerase [Novosphingobium sp. P6W]
MMPGNAGRLAALVLVAAVSLGAAPAQTSPAAPTPAAATAAPKVRVETLTAGTGEKPPEHSYVLINYKGMLPDGTVFDQNQQMPMALDEVVPGFALGLVQMQRGGKYKLTIPPELGYGAQASGPIPANATLVFEIDLLDFKTPEEIAVLMQQMQAQQSQAPAPQPGQ